MLQSLVLKYSFVTVPLGETLESWFECIEEVTRAPQVDGKKYTLPQDHCSATVSLPSRSVRPRSFEAQGKARLLSVALRAQRQQHWAFGGCFFADRVS